MRRGETLPGSAPDLIERARMAAVIVLLRAGAIGAKFGITLFVARFLDLETLGLYGFVTGAVVVIPVLTGQGVIGTLCRNSVDQAPRELVQALVPYWSLLAILYGGIVIAAAPWAYGDGHLPLLLLVGALIGVEHLNGDILLLLNHRRRPRLANVLLLVRTVAWIGSYIAAAYLAPVLRTLPTLLAFWLAGAGAALTCFFLSCRAWPWRSAAKLQSGLRQLRTVIRRSRLLYANEIVNTGSQYLDRYIVGALLGLELAGIYFLFWSFANALSNVVSSSLLQVQQPAILTARPVPAEQGRLLGRLRIEAAVTCGLLGSATGLLAHVFLTLFPRPGFTAEGPVLTVLIIGFVLRMAYEVEGIGLYARHEDRNTLLSGLGVLALSVSITAAVTSTLGLFGPALAVVVSYAAGGSWRLWRNASVSASVPVLPSAPQGDERG